ncbi:hypothetical protein D3C83_210260 [compost metagenome]
MERAERLENKIRAAAEALAKKDKALLSDILAYELAPLAEDEKKVVAALRALMK